MRNKARAATRAMTAIPPTMPPTTPPMLTCEVEDEDASEVALPLADCVPEGVEEGDEDMDSVEVAAGSRMAEYGPASVSFVERIAALKPLLGHPFWAQGLEVQQPMNVGKLNAQVYHSEPVGHTLFGTSG